MDIELRIKEDNKGIKLDKKKNTQLHELKNMTKKGENNYNFFEINEKNNYLLTELKANMRFWFRAFNVMDIKTLWEIEGILFGNSEKNKSPLSLKLRETLDKKNETVKLSLNFNSYVEKKYNSLRGEENLERIGELIDNLRKEKKIDNNLEKKYIVKALRIIFDKKLGIEWYKNLLELSIILGGIGKKTRSNHGILILEPKKVEGDDLIKKLGNLIGNITLTENSLFNGIKEVEELKKICECNIVSNEGTINDKPLEKVISSYNKNEIEYYMFDKEKYIKLSNRMKNIDDKKIKECHKYYSLNKKKIKSDMEQEEYEKLKIKYGKLEEKLKYKNDLTIEDYYRYEEYKNYKKDDEKHKNDKIYKNIKYSYCKKIFIMDSTKDNYEDPKPQATKFIYIKDKNNKNLTKVVEERGHNYEYYLGIRSKLYCDYEEKVYSPVAYTNYKYKEIKYSILIVLNNTCPKEEIFDYLEKGENKCT